MGRAKCVYIGPYVKIKLTPKEVSREIMGCNSPFCKYFRRETQWTFCTECGSKIVSIPITEKKLFTFNNLDDQGSHHGLDDNQSESFSALLGDCMPLNDNEEILIPNRSQGDGVLWPGDVSEAQDLDIQGIDISLALHRFNGEYSVDLKIIKKSVGEDNVQVKFGLINYSW